MGSEDIFALEKGELGEVVELCHSIETGDMSTNLTAAATSSVRLEARNQEND